MPRDDQRLILASFSGLEVVHQTKEDGVVRCLATCTPRAERNSKKGRALMEGPSWIRLDRTRLGGWDGLEGHKVGVVVVNKDTRFGCVDVPLHLSSSVRIEGSPVLVVTSEPKSSLQLSGYAVHDRRWAAKVRRDIKEGADVDNPLCSAGGAGLCFEGASEEHERSASSVEEESSVGWTYSRRP